MQRRAPGRTQAHISPPSSNMGSDSEKTSRLSQRSLGVTNRIWMLLVLLVFVLSFTHFILPSIGSAPVEQNYSNADLKAKNYFNATVAGPNPFEFCPVYGPGDELGAKYGAQTLSKSRMHLGSGGRVQRVLNRALAGQPVTISVLGGSGECLTLDSCNVALQPQQCRLVMALVTTQFHQSAIPQSSSNGGTRCSLTQLQNSQTALCDAPTLDTLAFATHTTCQT